MELQFGEFHSNQKFRTTIKMKLYVCSFKISISPKIEWNTLALARIRFVLNVGNVRVEAFYSSFHLNEQIYTFCLFHFAAKHMKNAMTPIGMSIKQF